MKIDLDGLVRRVQKPFLSLRSVETWFNVIISQFYTLIKKKEIWIEVSSDKCYLLYMFAVVMLVFMIHCMIMRLKKLLSWVSNSLTLSLIIVSLVKKFETILFFTLRQRIEKSLVLCKSNIHVKCCLHSYIHMHMWINLMPHLTTKNDITCLR